MMGTSRASCLRNSKLAGWRWLRHCSTTRSRKRTRLVVCGASPRVSPADISTPVTMDLQRCTWCSISCRSSINSPSWEIAGMRCQSPRMTASVDSGVPSSCAAPLASRPMRTMCSSSAARWRRSARRASRNCRLAMMRLMNATSKVALSPKLMSRPIRYSVCMEPPRFDMICNGREKNASATAQHAVTPTIAQA
ncbi:hypothetical protein D3C72_1547360 [compost metagenome]